VTGTITNDDLLTSKFATTWTYNGHTYGLVADLKIWSAAKAYAQTTGGYLAEIADLAENKQIFDRITGYAIANPDKNGDSLFEFSYANDGGGSAYAWMGGSDAKKEGAWVWDGSGEAISTNRQEWGSGKLGREPDNASGQIEQDYLALGLENWPYGSLAGQGFGKAGQWNDINGNNKLISIVEFNRVF
jgi:hypothetical protein